MKNSKKKVLQNCSPHEINKVPKKVKDQLKPIVQKLLNQCSNSKVLSRKLEWDEMKTNYALLQTIQELEKKYHFPVTDRSEHWEKFYEWCSEHGAKFSCVKVKKISDGNFGVVAEEDIKEHEPFLTIPRKMMMSEISAKNSKLGPLISKDPILQNMPNIQLAMHLLMEYLNPDSFWKPYISILPSTFDTVLYFTLEELQELQGSPVLDEVFKILRSVARQYCYFFQLFQNDSYAKSLNIGQYFTYDLYRWAVSAVMTRQNVIPTADGSQQVTSLVPFFDMCNHINGKLPLLRAISQLECDEIW